FGDQRGPTLAVGSTVWDVDLGGLYAFDLGTGQQIGQLSGSFTSYRTGLVAGQGTLLTRDYESGLIAFSREGPDTRISRRPDAHTSSAGARFEFSSEGEAATFECRLDGTA